MKSCVPCTSAFLIKGSCYFWLIVWLPLFYNLRCQKNPPMVHSWISSRHDNLVYLDCFFLSWISAGSKFDHGSKDVNELVKRKITVPAKIRDNKWSGKVNLQSLVIICQQYFIINWTRTKFDMGICKTISILLIKISCLTWANWEFTGLTSSIFFLYNLHVALISIFSFTICMIYILGNWILQCCLLRWGFSMDIFLTEEEWVHVRFSSITTIAVGEKWM